MIVGLSGKARAGKDSTASILHQEFGDVVHRVAFADGVREEAIASGAWDGTVPYTPAARTALQNIGLAKRQENMNYWVTKAFNKIDDHPEALWVVTDVRFKNEANAILSAGGQVWRIVRTNEDGSLYDNGMTDEQKHHPSETDLDDFPFAVYVTASNLEMLGKRAIILAKPLVEDIMMKVGNAY